MPITYLDEPDARVTYLDEPASQITYLDAAAPLTPDDWDAAGEHYRRNLLTIGTSGGASPAELAEFRRRQGEFERKGYAAEGPAPVVGAAPATVLKASGGTFGSLMGSFLKGLNTLVLKGQPPGEDYGLLTPPAPEPTAAERRAVETASPVYQLGQWFQERAANVLAHIPEREQGTVMTQMTESVAGLAPILTGTGAPVVFGLLKTGDVYDTAYQDALDKGKSKGEAAQSAANKAYLSGAKETAVWALGPPVLKKFIGDRILRTAGTDWASRWLAQTGAGGVTVGGTAAGSTALQNVIEGKPVGEDVGTEFVAGTILARLLHPTAKAPPGRGEVPFAREIHDVLDRFKVQPAPKTAASYERKPFVPPEAAAEQMAVGREPAQGEVRVTDETVFNEALARQQALQAEITARQLPSSSTPEAARNTENVPAASVAPSRATVPAAAETVTPPAQSGAPVFDPTAAQSALARLKAKAAQQKAQAEAPELAGPRELVIDPAAAAANRKFREDQARLAAERAAAKANAPVAPVAPPGWQPPRAEPVAPVPLEDAPEVYRLRDAVNEHGGMGAPPLEAALNAMRKGRTAEQVVNEWSGGAGEYDALKDVLEEIAGAREAGNLAEYRRLRKAYEQTFAGNKPQGADRVLAALQDDLEAGRKPSGGLPENEGELIERAWAEASRPVAEMDRAATALAQEAADFEAFTGSLTVKEGGIFSGDQKLATVRTSKSGRPLVIPEPEAERLPPEYQAEILRRAGVETEHGMALATASRLDKLAQAVHGRSYADLEDWQQYAIRQATERGTTFQRTLPVPPELRPKYERPAAPVQPAAREPVRPLPSAAAPAETGRQPAELTKRTGKPPAYALAGYGWAAEEEFLLRQLEAISKSGRNLSPAQAEWYNEAVWRREKAKMGWMGGVEPETEHGLPGELPLGGGPLPKDFDPTILRDLTQLAGSVIEGGATDFPAYARAMHAALDGQFQPYYHAAYNQVRDFTEAAPLRGRMTPREEIENYDSLGQFTGGAGTAGGGSVLPGTVGGDGKPRRPGLRVVDEGSLPAPRPIVRSGEYAGPQGHAIDETQRFAVNLALTAFEDGKPAFLLGDGTGVGKTGSELAIAAQSFLKTKLPSLIITANEGIIEQRFKEDQTRFGIPGQGIEFATYDQLAGGKIPRKPYGVVIFDEAQKLKTYSSLRSTASRLVDAKHRVYATATPMDAPHQAAYFLAELTGRTREQVAAGLGFKFEMRPDRNGRIKEHAVLLDREKFSWHDVIDNLKRYRNQAVASGQLVRREYPFFGQAALRDAPAYSAEQKAEQSKIERYWDERIARIPPYASQARRNVSGQKTHELGRWAEAQKIPHVLAAVEADLQAGKRVIVFAKGINDTAIKGAGKTVPGTLNALAKELDARGIKYGRVYGPNKSAKTQAVQDFQKDRVKVLLSTTESGGAGFDMDDVFGDRPRAVHAMTLDFSAEVMDQAFGRVSRRNTASPADFHIWRNTESYADRRRTAVADLKLRVLRNIQAGEDLDTSEFVRVAETGEIGMLERNHPPIDEIFSGTPTVLTDEGKLVSGYDHADAKRRAEARGLTVSGYLGERSGWFKNGKNYLAKDVEFGFPDETQFSFEPMETPAEQVARLKALEERQRIEDGRLKMAQKAQARLTGTTGDLGQGDLLGAPQDLWAGREHGMALPSWVRTDRPPKIIERPERHEFKTGEAVTFRVYHGSNSPHIRKPRMSGDSNNTQAAGLYVTIDPKIARNYKPEDLKAWRPATESEITFDEFAPGEWRVKFRGQGVGVTRHHNPATAERWLASVRAEKVEYFNRVNAHLKPIVQPQGRIYSWWLTLRNPVVGDAADWAAERGLDYDNMSPSDVRKAMMKAGHDGQIDIKSGDKQVVVFFRESLKAKAPGVSSEGWSELSSEPQQLSPSQSSVRFNPQPGVTPAEGAIPPEAAAGGKPEIEHGAPSIPAGGVADLPVEMQRTKPGQVDQMDIMAALEDVSRAAGGQTPIRTGRFYGPTKRAIYKELAEVVRIKGWQDIPAATHEIAHDLAKQVFGGVSMPGGASVPASRLVSSLAPPPAAKAELVALGKALYGSKIPIAGYQGEGWAEYLRHWLSTEDAAKLAPNMTRWFEAEFLPGNQDVGQALTNARNVIDTWRYQGAEGRLAAQVRTRQPGNLMQALGGLREFASLKGQVETLTPLLEASKLAAKRSGAPLPASEDPFWLATLTRKRAAGVVETMVNRHMVDIFGRVTGPSLDEAFATMRGDRQGALLAIYAKQALNRWAEGKNPGISKADAEQYLRDHDTPEVNIMLRKVFKWQRGLLDYRIQADPSFARVADRFSEYFYAPLARVISAERAKPRDARAPSNPLHRMKGSSLPVKDIIDQMLVNATRMVNAADHALVQNAVFKLAQIEGMGSIVERIPKSRVKRRVNIEAVREQLEAMGVDTTGVPVDTLLEWWTPADMPRGASPILVAGHGADRTWFEVSPKIYEAVQSINLPGLKGAFPTLPAVGQVLDLLIAAPNRVFRLGTTGLRASFGLVTNVIRDAQTLPMQTRTRNPARLALTYPAAWGEVLKAAFTGQRSAVTDAFYNLGAHMGQPLGLDISHTKRATDRLFHGRVLRLIDPVRHPFDTARKVFGIPESVPRIAEMKAVLHEMGWREGMPMTPDQAVMAGVAAKRVTVDFTAGGAYSRIMNDVMPFYNPAVQGGRSFARAFKEHPARTTLLGLSLFTLPALLNWYRNRDKEWWRALPWREKAVYTHLDDGQNVWQIPRNFEWGQIFQAIPVALFDAAYQRDPEAFKQAGIEETLKRLVEWDNWKERSVTEAGKGALATLNPLSWPTLLKVYQEQNANWISYWERPIVPESDSPVPAEQIGPYTSRLAISLGRALPGVSPRRVDAAIRAYFGGAGPDTLSLLGLGAPTSEREAEFSDVPVLGVAARRGGAFNAQNQHVTDFYESLENATGRADAWRKRRRDAGVLDAMSKRGLDLITPDMPAADRATLRQAALGEEYAAVIGRLLKLARHTRDTETRGRLYMEAGRWAQDGLAAMAGQKVSPKGTKLPQLLRANYARQGQ